MPAKPRGATPTTVNSVPFDANGAAEERGRQSGLAPGGVRRDRDAAARPGPLFLGRERAARGQRHAERREVVGRDERRERLLRVASPSPIADDRERVRHQAFEDAGPVAQVEVGGIGEVAVAIGLDRDRG